MSDKKDKEQQIRDERLRKRQEENISWEQYERLKEEQSRDSGRNSKEHF
jgi:hypothetical protein